MLTTQLINSIRPAICSQGIGNIQSGGAIRCPLSASLVRLAPQAIQVEAYPRPLMKWTEKLYRGAFGEFGDFRLQENGEPAIHQQHATLHVCHVWLQLTLSAGWAQGSLAALLLLTASIACLVCNLTGIDVNVACCATESFTLLVEQSACYASDF